MPHFHVYCSMNLLVSYHVLLALRSYNISSALHCAVYCAPLPSGPKYLVLVSLRREIVATEAKLARAWGVAWANGRCVLWSSAEEAKENFDVLVEHGKAGADKTGIGFDHGPVCCWNRANYFHVLDLI